MKFEIEFWATIILSMQAVTGMMVPSRPNYGNGDTCNCSDPQGTVESAQIQQLSCFGSDIYIHDLEGGEAKPDFLTSAVQ